MSGDHAALICDPVDPALARVLSASGVSVDSEPEITAERLAERIGEYEIVVVRSRTRLTRGLIGAASRCRIIARVGVGLDNIDAGPPRPSAAYAS